MGGSFAMDSLTGSMLGHFMAKPLSAPKTPSTPPSAGKSFGGTQSFQLPNDMTIILIID